jgi:chloramphenicol O-acetyltransferase type A
MEENKVKVDIETYKYSRQYKRFMTEPDPSVCVTGCFDITNLLRLRKKGHKLNAMLCYCIQQAGQNIEEFHYAIKEDGLYYYKNVKTNAVINGVDGELYFVDYKYCEKFEDFEKEYDRVNDYYSKHCSHFSEDTGALLSTSTILGYPFSSIDLGLSKTFWDNFLMWGNYKKRWLKAELNITLRFHHATIDGQRAAKFFSELQKQIKQLKIK